MNSKIFFEKQAEIAKKIEFLTTKYKNKDITLEEYNKGKSNLANESNKLRFSFELQKSNKIIKIASIIFAFIVITLIGLMFSNRNSVANGSTQSNIEITPNNDPYQILHNVFVGYPDKEQIQKLIDPVIARHKMAVIDGNVLKVGNALVFLREKSAIGVTEMQILKHAYQNNLDNFTIDEQLAFSATILERYK